MLLTLQPARKGSTHAPAEISRFPVSLITDNEARRTDKNRLEGDNKRPEGDKKRQERINVCFALIKKNKFYSKNSMEMNKQSEKLEKATTFLKVVLICDQYIKVLY